VGLRGVQAAVLNGVSQCSCVLALANNLACGLRHNSRKFIAVLLAIENAFDCGLDCKA
jgi:hypothetical protein